MKKSKRKKPPTVAPLPLPSRSSLWLKIALSAALTFIALATINYFIRGSDGSAPGPPTASRADHHTAQPGGPAAPATASPPAAPAGVNAAAAPGPAPEGMVWVPGGTFRMGCDDCRMPDASPVHLVTVDGFWMDQTPVTNAQFARFVKAAGYQTVAERQPDPKNFPGAPPENLVPGCAVFSPPPRDIPLDNPYAWWRYVPGASWKSPEGPGSSTAGREDHPVVHIAWEDAAAYAKWANKRLPTEAEFEFAARGGLDRKRYSWGDELKPGGKWMSNIFQGDFPSKNTVEDGFATTAPVTAFPPNNFKLYDMAGNVWQWCSDWYRPDYFERLAARGVVKNPPGPEDSFDPQEPGVPKRVLKSGSFICSDQYCERYLVGSRGKGAVDSGGSNVGFRCVRAAS